MTNKTVDALLPWFREHARDLPWRRTRDPYAIWVSEIMLQQTQVKTVIPYWTRWMAALPDIHALGRATEMQLYKLWEGLGYYSRVRNMHRAAQVIVDNHPGNFPATFDAILALPGIGRYTAGAIASIAFSLPYPIVDGNIRRVLTRLWAIHDDPRQAATDARLWHLAGTLVTRAAPLHPQGCGQLNQALMELGAVVCVPKNPNCIVCPLQGHCRARRQGLTAVLPTTTPRPAITQRRFVAFVIRWKNRFLVRQRPAGRVNARLWEFPNFEPQAFAETAGSGATDTSPRSEQFTSRCEDSYLAGLPVGNPACVIKHSITRYRITLEVHETPPVRVKSSVGLEGSWLSLEELATLPFTSAHRKIVAHFSSLASSRDASTSRNIGPSILRLKRNARARLGSAGAHTL